HADPADDRRRSGADGAGISAALPLDRPRDFPHHPTSRKFVVAPRWPAADGEIAIGNVRPRARRLHAIGHRLVIGRALDGIRDGGEVDIGPRAFEMLDSGAEILIALAL